MSALAWRAGSTVIRGVLVPIFRTGLVLDRIAIQGGTRWGYLVQPADGGDPCVVLPSDVLPGVL